MGIVCTESRKKLNSVNLNPNMALRATIDEWKERNEAARIKVALAALCLGSTENMVREAIDDLRRVCEGKPYKGAGSCHRNNSVASKPCGIPEQECKMCNLGAFETIGRR